VKTQLRAHGSSRLLGLILTHILQTEVKIQMSALKKGLQREPAFPDGSPTGRTIMAACQIATQARDLRPEGPHRHGGRRVTRTLGQDGQHQRLNHLASRALGVEPRVSTDLHQAYGQRGQQPQRADQPVNGLQLPFFNATATLEAVMIVLNGLITNDKFCMSRTARLHLSHWRLPRSARQSSSEEVQSPAEEHVQK
jgi:hypothetical protein